MKYYEACDIKIVPALQMLLVPVESTGADFQSLNILGPSYLKDHL